MGRDGERWTERELRSLEREGWRILHDLPSGYRDTNIDHVAIGPGGVFLLNSKNLWGDFAVEDGLLNCHHEAAPASDYALTRLHKQMGGAAYGFQARLKQNVGWIVDVHPLVVLWAKFEEKEGTLRDGVVVVRGDRVAGWLSTQNRRIADADFATVVAAAEAMDGSG